MRLTFLCFSPPPRFLHFWLLWWWWWLWLWLLLLVPGYVWTLEIFISAPGAWQKLCLASLHHFLPIFSTSAPGLGNKPSLTDLDTLKFVAVFSILWGRWQFLCAAGSGFLQLGVLQLAVDLVCNERQSGILLLVVPQTEMVSSFATDWTSWVPVLNLNLQSDSIKR